MKKTSIYSTLLALVVAAVSCQNKELHDPIDKLPGDVTVRINWTTGLSVPYADGMRINLFSLTPNIVDYGRADVSWNGGTVRLQQGASYITYAYNYTGNNLQFFNETDPVQTRATVSDLTRATYSRAFPGESTINSISGSMHLGVNPSYTVLQTTEPQFIDVYPENIVVTYTYEIRGVVGAQFIHSARGGISGFSASYFIATGAFSATPSTVLFDGSQVNPASGTITGSFRTFGRLDLDNNFTIEILFPSKTAGGGIIQKTWDVTRQINNGTNFHILIDDSGIEIPDEGGGDGDGDDDDGTTGWKVDLDDWNDVAVPLN